MTSYELRDHISNTIPMNQINLEYLHTLADNNDDIIRQMIELFIGQIPEFFNEMDTALSEKNAERMHRVAHKAKSSLSIMGMVSASEQLQELELLAKKKKKTETYSKYVENFKTNINEALIELKEVLVNLKK